MIEEQAQHLSVQHLGEIVQEIIDRSHNIPAGSIPHECLEKALNVASEAVIGNETDLGRDLYQIILEKCADCSTLCQDIPLEFTSTSKAQTMIISKLLN